MTGARGVIGFSCMLRLVLARWSDDPEGVTLWLPGSGSFWAVDDDDACTPTAADTGGDELPADGCEHRTAHITMKVVLQFRKVKVKSTMLHKRV